MNVMHLSVECYPVAKVGGLGDVVGALPKYLAKAGVNSSVVLPFYEREFTAEHEFDTIHSGTFSMSGRSVDFTVLKERNNSLGFSLFLIRIPGLLDRQNVYGYHDEAEQFIAFQTATLYWIIDAEFKPDIIHCHDHHCGLIPFMVTQCQIFDPLKGIPTVLTIHNAQYQGWLGWDQVGLLPEFNSASGGLLDWNRSINSLAAGIKCCWNFTTVSPNYLDELTRQSNGLEELFLMENQKGLGILNGIDLEVWNPETDPMIKNNYGPDTATKARKENKKELCRQFGLDHSKPLFAFIGRLVSEKGADFLPGIVRNSRHTYSTDVNFLILGSGHAETEQALENLKSADCGVFVGYDENLAHDIYSAADFLLMPSRVEPCGLNQMYALRYGSMPIVHSTGGLIDTVTDISEPGGYGIRFEGLTEGKILEAIDRAVQLYPKRKTLSALRSRMMKLDFSWERSASDYINLYHRLIQSA